jgi:hypothetical protein
MLDGRWQRCIGFAGLLLAIVALAMVPVRWAAGSGDEPAAVEVQVRGAAQEAATTRYYVALVAEDRPWSEPAAERLLPAGVSGTTWQVVPGRYRAVCAAAGREVVFLGVFEAAASERREVECAPASLVQVSGRLAAADGSPIAGAKVGLPHAFLSDFSTRLSVLGEEVAAADRSTRSGADGRFVLAGPGKFKNSIWIEAEGYAPYDLQNVLFEAPTATNRGTDVGVVRLTRGASLTVTVAPLPPGVAPDRYRVALRRGGAVFDRGEQDRLAQRIWQRPLAAGLLRWPSLEAGTYSVVAVPLDESGEPAELTRVALQAGQAASVEAAVGGKVSLPAAAGIKTGGPGSLRLLAVGGGAGVAVGASSMPFEVRRLDGAAVPKTPAMLAAGSVAARWSVVSGGTLGEVAGGCRAGAEYWLRGEGEVSPEIEVKGDDCGPSVPLKIYPAGEVHGRIVVPVGAARPATVRVRAAQCPKGPGQAAVPAGRFPSPVAKDGSWSAEVPAGCLELAVEAGDFAPAAYHQIATATGRKTDLGVQALSFGASLLTRVVADDGTPLVAAVSLLPAAGVARALSDSYAGREVPALAEGRSASSGWVHLTGLQEGRFVLRVRASGRPLFVSDPFELAARLELVLDDLRVPAPAVLRVHLVPSDDVASLQATYTVTANGLGPPDWIHGTALRVAAGKDNTAQFPALVSGRWQIRAMVRMSSGEFPLGRREVNLLPGATTIEMPVDGRMYHGHVTYHDAPLAAALDLRPVSRGEARSPVYAESGADGEFTVALPQGGGFSARIAARKPALHTTLPLVVFGDPSETVEVEVPDATLDGRVVDDQAKSVPKVLVTARQVADSPPSGDGQSGELISTDVETLSDEQGLFHFDGLGDGRWLLQASRRELRSDQVPVDVPAAPGQDAVTLVLADRDKVSGHVLSPDGQPVAGARVSVTFPPGSGLPIAAEAMAVSEDDGSFAVDRLAPLGTPVNVAVAAPGLPVTTSRRALDVGALELQLAPSGGEIDLTLAQGSWSDFAANLLVLVADDGSFVGTATAGARVSSQVLSVPNLASGHWTLARIDSAAHDAALAVGGGRSLSPLASLDLRPGQVAQAQVATLRP